MISLGAPVTQDRHSGSAAASFATGMTIEMSGAFIGRQPFSVAIQQAHHLSMKLFALEKPGRSRGRKPLLCPIRRLVEARGRESAYLLSRNKRSKSEDKGKSFHRAGASLCPRTELKSEEATPVS